MIHLTTSCKENANVINKHYSWSSSHKCSKIESRPEDCLWLFNVSNRSGGIYFLDAPGGIGKTFLISLLFRIRSQNDIAPALALSGKAAALLEGKEPHTLCWNYRYTCKSTRHHLGKDFTGVQADYLARMYDGPQDVTRGARLWKIFVITEIFLMELWISC